MTRIIAKRQNPPMVPPTIAPTGGGRLARTWEVGPAIMDDEGVPDLKREIIYTRFTTNDF